LPTPENAPVAQEEEEGPASPWYATSTETDSDSLLGSIPEEDDEEHSSRGGGGGGGGGARHDEDVEANGARLSFSSFGSMPKR